MSIVLVNLNAPVKVVALWHKARLFEFRVTPFWLYNTAALSIVQLKEFSNRLNTVVQKVIKILLGLMIY